VSQVQSNIQVRSFVEAQTNVKVQSNEEVYPNVSSFSQMLKFKCRIESAYLKHEHNLYLPFFKTYVQKHFCVNLNFKNGEDSKVKLRQAE
jgi:hypothetical protein